MQVRRYVVVRVDGREGRLDALFDPGSSITVTSYEAVEELIGPVPSRRLAKARWVVLANGQKATVDAYIDAEILIDEHTIEERIYLSRDLVREAVVEGRRLKLPDLIIGAPTMESWGIELDLRRGEVRACREGFALL
jgi:hypothetical protein